MTLDEVKATDPDGASFGGPVFDQSTFTVVKGSTIQIGLDNPVTLASGDFSVAKQVTGSGAALVGPDAEFTAHYSYRPATDTRQAWERSP